MKRTAFYLGIMLLCAAVASCCNGGSQNPMYVMASDYVALDGTSDVSDGLQRMIDENPNRTLIFPDGTYLLSKPICTPADPTKSVHLILANYAVIKADGQWPEGEALIKLGGKDPYNSIYINGSNYGIEGGIIDGSEVAAGISVDSGRETRISQVSIKHTSIGIHIKHGANSGSADADIRDVNIVGNNNKDAIGVLLEGYDNTLTNMRIAKVNVGVKILSGGNNLRNIHPLFIFGDNQDYESSVGFYIGRDSNNFMDYCYSDQFATGFKIEGHAAVNMTDCFAWWYNGKVPFQTAIECGDVFNALVNGMHIGFCDECEKVDLLKATKGGRGKLVSPLLVRNKNLSSDDISKYHIQ